MTPILDVNYTHWISISLTIQIQGLYLEIDYKTFKLKHVPFKQKEKYNLRSYAHRKQEIGKKLTKRTDAVVSIFTSYSGGFGFESWSKDLIAGE
jgi:hypothetical protein